VSEYRGDIRCPQCGNRDTVIQNWDTYQSVICKRCGHKHGEIEASEKIVPVPRYETMSLRRFLLLPNGSWVWYPLTVEAVSGGGILVRVKLNWGS
jgi:uncharacterized paraquat-inducible protein A